MYGLFIGTSISSVILFIFRVIPITTIGMIIILYLYAVVGGITGFVIHKRLEISQVNQDPKTAKTDERTAEEVDKPEIKTQEDNEQDPIKRIDYGRFIDKMSDIKKSSCIVIDLLKTSKKIEDMKKESNSILEDSIKDMEKKAIGIKGQ